MHAEYRFMRVRNGVSRFAQVAILATSAAESRIVVDSALDEWMPIYGDAVRKGIAVAIAGHDARRGSPREIRVESLVESAVDTSNDAVECAAAIAAWKALGYDENDAIVVFEDARWSVRIVPPNG